MGNWQLSKQGIRWPELHDHITGSSLNFSKSHVFWAFPLASYSGLLIFRGKKRKISRDFQGQIRGKIGQFRGKKVIIRGKNRPISRDFRGRKVKNCRKIVGFRGILAEKSQISKDFQGQILRKIGRFPGLFHGKFLRQETIGKKQPISLDFFWQISLKSINFASIWPALFNVVFFF